jgi:glutamine amidotransferase
MPRKITIVDYGLGNIFSVREAFTHIGCQVDMASTCANIAKADFLVLPGVGAFKKGMHELSQLNLIPAILNYIEMGKPLLGICLGMQLLFESSEENGFTQGLGIIPGKVMRIVPENVALKIPHIGWGKLTLNSTHPQADSSLGKTIQNKFAYFVHSFHPVPTQQDHLLATTQYEGQTIHAMVMRDNIIGCQFHPEKSGDNLLPFLKEITAVNAMFETFA